jgi:DNA modification methylase
MMYWNIIHGDAFEEIGKIDGITAIITDPPYGVQWKGHSASTRTWDQIKNDDGSMDLRPILNMPCLVISFGANCYPSQLPHRGRWICWDKRTCEAADRMLGSPFELAWCNKTSGYDKMYRVMHGGVVNADGHGERRVHPTQKPISLLRKIILDHTKPGDLIVDPFCGSGSTGVAAVTSGRDFIGIDVEEKYCKISSERIREAVGLFNEIEQPDR